MDAQDVCDGLMPKHFLKSFQQHPLEYGQNGKCVASDVRGDLAYNMESYLDRCVNSLLSASDISDLEVLIVDDGSKDGTLEYARKLERTNPGAVRAIHQENKGHGGAVNTGLANASGFYFKVVDSDDWLDPAAMFPLMVYLRSQLDSPVPCDMVVANYVYDKVDEGEQKVMGYGNVLPEGYEFGWDEVGTFLPSQYLLMHSVYYRTEMLRKMHLELPEHTFYVDNIFVYEPSPTYHHPLSH